jgi:hypothetical protein
MSKTRSKYGYIISAIVASALSPMSTSARAQASPDPSAVDVLGFRLGMTPDEVKSLGTAKITDAVFDVKQGTLSMGSYKTPPIVFGVRIAPKDTINPTDKEIIKITFDTRPPYKTIDISRHRVYSQDNAGELNQTIEALISKYGRPVGRQEAAWTALYWSWNSAFSYNHFNDSKSTQCILSLSEINLAGQLFGGAVSENRDASLSKCGVWMEVRLVPMSKNPALLEQIFVDYGDVSAMRASELSILDTLKTGAAAAAAGERAKAAKKKPEL